MRQGAVERGHLLANLVRFGALLRRAGMAVTAEQLADLLAAVEHVGLERRVDFKAAAQAVLVGRREELELFERAFELFWRHETGAPGPRQELGRMLAPSLARQAQVAAQAASPAPAAEGGEDTATIVDRRPTYSDRERLRFKDFAQLTPEEARQVSAILRQPPFMPAPRRTRRRVPGGGADGAIDLRRTQRRSLRHGGEPLLLARCRRKERPRPLVALCDVSGSMEPYSRILLQFLYGLGGAAERYHAFAFGTRLTALTRQLAQRDADRALAEAAAAIADFGGGTRIGEAIKRFNFDWSRRVLGQGAVVLVISDGWDRGDPQLLAREVGRLKRSCQRLIWLNPLLGIDGYEPLTRGLVAVLPLVDDFLPVHNLDSLEQLGALLARLDRRRAGGFGVQGGPARPREVQYA